MLFNSLHFLIFFPIVVGIYYLIPQKIRTYWLLAASYYFYMCWNAKYVVLLLFSTIVTYVSGLAIEKSEKMKGGGLKKKLCVAAGFTLNLSLLFLFKYLDFGIESLNAVLGHLHIALHAPEMDLLLPVGISFYTFQALGYTIDVYRGEIYAEKNFFKYALFVSFFPQLVAGPIERSKNLLRQLDKPGKPTVDSLRDGLLLMLWGYFLKVVLADRIAVFVDTVYGDFETYTGVYLIVATLLFAVQVYCDFYGYSVIAMGAAEILGIQLMENFDAPYLSASVAELWRRWHISLSSWFRDYLYIPLGGNRKGRLRKYANLLITFGVSGLWHGADWSYVIWGLMNGAYQVAGDLLAPVKKKAAAFLEIKEDSFSHRCLRVVTTFFLFDLSLVFFRSDTAFHALRIIKRIFTAKNHWVWFDGSLYECGVNQKNFTLMLWGTLMLFAADVCKRKGVRIREIVAKQDYWAQLLTVIAAVFGILLFGMWGVGYDAANFIYFQF